MARFEDTGDVSVETARRLGVIGMADGRRATNATSAAMHRPAYYRFAQIPVSTWHTGDAFARAYVRH